ncbi:MAG: hypothetical protein WCA46_30740 [Actinocatenispora sp.]
MAIFLFQGEWTEASTVQMGLEEARTRGTQEFADRQKKTTFNRERTMVNRGLPTYLEVPDEFARSIVPNDPYEPSHGYFGHTLSECRRHNKTHLWTDGLITVPAPVIKKALDVHLKMGDGNGEMARISGDPHFQEIPKEDQQQILDMLRQRHPMTPESLARSLDFTKCEQTGPLLVITKNEWHFENPASKTEKYYFLTALYDPHAYGFTATDDTRNIVKPGFAGASSGYTKLPSGRYV